MKTNFRIKTHFVLLNEESYVVAIIECDKGESDISGKLILAISEEYDCESVEFLNAEDLDMFSYDILFDVKYIDEGEECIRTLQLVRTAIY